MAYLTLFCISFLAATLLPLGSEALLLYDISQDYNIELLWSVATMGNTLGSILNYWLGLKGESYLEQKGYISTKNIRKYRDFFDKYGGWVLLLSWVPIIGDQLTFAAGALHYNLKYFILTVFIAKGIRYGVIIFFASNLSV